MKLFIKPEKAAHTVYALMLLFCLVTLLPPCTGHRAREATQQPGTVVSTLDERVTLIF